jgi:hypothetical protein
MLNAQNKNKCKLEISFEISEFHIAHAEKRNGIAMFDVPRR